MISGTMNEEQFHWQSQSITGVESATGQRYINQSRNGTREAVMGLLDVLVENGSSIEKELYAQFRFNSE